jgi:hypothetical protein
MFAKSVVSALPLFGWKAIILAGNRACFLAVVQL